jgi:zinc finger protein
MENIDINEQEPDVLENQKCPICGKDTLTLTESERDIPYFGRVYLFSMTCSDCKYHKADIETADENEPAKYEITINSEEDMKIRVVKSSHATVRIGRIMTIEPGVASQGFVTNIEGLLKRVKYALETARECAEDDDDKKKAKNHLKKLQKIMWGQEEVKITIDDPTGNSAIISEKTIKSKGKKK